MKFGKKLKIVWKENLIVKQYTTKKYLKGKRKSNNGKINTNFHNNKIPKEDSQYICLSIIFLDSIFRTGKNYYPQVFLQECKYGIKEKKRFLSILLLI